MKRKILSVLCTYFYNTIFSASNLLLLDQHSTVGRCPLKVKHDFHNKELDIHQANMTSPSHNRSPNDDDDDNDMTRLTPSSSTSGL